MMEPAEDGYFFIDQNGPRFQYILELYFYRTAMELMDYLRNKAVPNLGNNETDLELSLEAAVQSGVKAITVIASNAGR